MPAPPPVGLGADARLRHELAALLRGRQAHVDAAAALDGIPPEARDARPDDAPHTLWELLYHVGYAQRDILDFARGGYEPRDWPADYWPDGPSTPGLWAETRAAFEADLDALADAARTADLTAELDHAPGYTWLRQILLAADHTSHHLGQIVALRRRLGIWPGDG